MVQKQKFNYIECGKRNKRKITEKKREERKISEEKAAKRRAEKKAQLEKLTEDETFTISATGTDVKKCYAEPLSCGFWYICADRGKF